MEETSYLSELWPIIIPVIVGVASVALGYFWGKLKGYAEGTEAEWDDKLIYMIEEVIASKKTSPDADSN